MAIVPSLPRSVATMNGCSDEVGEVAGQLWIYLSKVHCLVRNVLLEISKRVCLKSGVGFEFSEAEKLAEAVLS